MTTRDIAIIGAGPAGLAMACSLARQGLTVTLVEKLDEAVLAAPPDDGREIALTFRSRDILQSLGIWAHLPPDEIAAIRGARVEQEGSLGFLNLGEAEPLGFLVSNHHIRAAAFKAAKCFDDHSLRLITGAAVTRIDTRGDMGDGATLMLDKGDPIDARLIVGADSRFSATRRQMGIPTHMHDFGREVIVCRMQHERSHGGIAHECFRWGKTLAVLPMNGNQCSVVMTVKSPDAEALMRLDDEALAREVAHQFSHRLGRMTVVGQRHRYPLVATYARRFYAPRFALIGDAAVGMHPVTAHGFNFGLYGVESLSREIRSARQAGRDWASENVLRRYQRAHRLATWLIFSGTNALVKLYTDDSRPARAVRGRLLRMADRILPLKRRITHHLTDIPRPQGLGRLLPRQR